MKKFGLLILSGFLLSAILYCQSYNGSYTLTNEGNTLTLILEENTTGAITGSLSSTTGVNYSLEGQLEEGVALGICSDGQSGLYFEAYLEGTNLTLGLIEADEYNMPDYNTAQYYNFTKQAPTSNPQPPTSNQQPPTNPQPPNRR